jgi:hypothetical protein
MEDLAMTTNELQTAVEREIEMRKEEVEKVFDQCDRLIEEMRSGRSLNHGAHNLASRTQELAVLAGKIEMAERVFFTLKGGK